MRTVVLYGKSLILSSIGASLEARADLRIVVVDPGVPGAAETIGALRPDVIVFDLTTVQPDSALGLWRARPHAVLIGIDLRTEAALLLSGQSFEALTPEDLLQVIDNLALQGSAA